MADIANNAPKKHVAPASTRSQQASANAPSEQAQAYILPANVPVVNAAGLRCPMPVLKAQRALASLRVGERIALLSSDPATERELKAYCTQAGHTLAAVTPISAASSVGAHSPGHEHSSDTFRVSAAQSAPAVLFEIICGAPARK